MTTFAVVTTCNEAQWGMFGQRMAATFHKHWPEDVNLYLYAEGFSVETSDRLQQRTMPKWVQTFKDTYPGAYARGWVGTQYDLFRDAVKFSHKVGAWTDAALYDPPDVLIVADADIVTHAPVTHEWLDGLLPDDAYIGWLERDGHYPECGFFIINCQHKVHYAIVQDIRELYMSGRLFDYSQTHDCIALQAIIWRYQERNLIKVHSLSGKARRSMHPLANGPLGERLDHLKGERKILGRTPKHERVVKDGNPYWK